MLSKANLNAFERPQRAVIARRLFQPTACPDFGEAIFLVIIASMKDCFVVSTRNDGFYMESVNGSEVQLSREIYLDKSLHSNTDKKSVQVALQSR